ncbi:MAG TPA: PepSY-associated TM helix domain-containing protein [Allosphingosinicella sp.]|nr:PepSY-associated TM helix domain-containing protein [Allosphingosinicella sp.]
MTSPNLLRLRRFWFQLHKWIGLALAVLIIPISLTGSALVWHDWLDDRLNPERVTSASPALAPSAYAAAARKLAGPGERLSALAFPDGAGPVVATLSRPPKPGAGRPVRTLLYLDPANARLLDRSASNEGVVQVLHVLHGSLMVPGVGRQIVGWIGVAMLLSSLSGLWLWWPLQGRFSEGLRWRRHRATSGNLHHQAGFWIVLPLAMLSFTGAWISFPAFFASLSGDPAGPSPAERMRRMAVRPAEATRLDPESALAAARPLATGALVTLTWPTEPEMKWKASFRRQGAPAEVSVDDRSGAATPPKPPQPETTARLMRRLHDGTGMGPLWQTIIFVGGIIPALLAVTGILMWLSLRRRRGRSAAAPARA